MATGDFSNHRGLLNVGWPMITVTYCNCLVVSTTHFLDDGPLNDPQG